MRLGSPRLITLAFKAGLAPPLGVVIQLPALFWKFCYGPSNYPAQGAPLLTTFVKLVPLGRATLLMTLFLFPNGLAAQARLPLPWETAPALSWRAGLGSRVDDREAANAANTGAEDPIPKSASTPSKGPITVKLSVDGTLRIVGAKGVRRLRMGLPGRPLRAWRDGGIPLDLTAIESMHESWRFPLDTPLAKGIQTLPWGGEDFRIALDGLLWILDDGEHFLAMVHPATARVVFLPLPTGQNFSVRMTPGHLELLENPSKDASSAPRRWSLPWLALLPQFAKLARPEDIPPPGTALQPFPKD